MGIGGVNGPKVIASAEGAQLVGLGKADLGLQQVSSSRQAAAAITKSGLEPAGVFLP